ncbi:MAG TPA: glutathione S-transferase family protein [Alphaproteobacteria bacterium]|jgi:glutathione S-transferase|nr:glutathione S-transferase family protein [Alphaproteobacteria bacterium]MDP7429554.1 glutathione S-transferase family protein [Alphaproteobacteria bacterium]HJM50959.1 glutathione S-transferase family protein [Alphaproteobacteria bacterium]
MKLFHAPNSRSMRIVWLLEELGLEYELVGFKLGDKAMREPEYLRLNPMGRVPTLQDGDVTIFESGAIVEYVLARHGGGRMVPDSASPEFADYLQWLHYAEGMIMPQVNIIIVETLFLPEEKRNPVNLARAQKLLNKSLQAVETGLEGRDYVAGGFSGADIMTGHACVVAERLGADLAELPNVKAYVERLKNRPALQMAMAA